MCKAALATLPRVRSTLALPSSSPPVHLPTRTRPPHTGEWHRGLHAPRQLALCHGCLVPACPTPWHRPPPPSTLLFPRTFLSLVNSPSVACLRPLSHASTPSSARLLRPPPVGLSVPRLLSLYPHFCASCLIYLRQSVMFPVRVLPRPVGRDALYFYPWLSVPFRFFTVLLFPFHRCSRRRTQAGVRHWTLFLCGKDESGAGGVRRLFI